MRKKFVVDEEEVEMNEEKDEVVEKEVKVSEVVMVVKEKGVVDKKEVEMNEREVDGCCG